MFVRITNAASVEVQCGSTVWKHSVEAQCGSTVWKYSVEVQCGSTRFPLASTEKRCVSLPGFHFEQHRVDIRQLVIPAVRKPLLEERFRRPNLSWPLTL